MSQVHDDLQDFKGPVRFRQGIQGPTPATFGALTVLANVLTADINAGKILLPAIVGSRYRILDWKLVARGGAATAVTSVDIKDTNSSPVFVAVVLAAALTQNKVVGPGMASVTDGTSGSMGQPLTVSKGVQVAKDGSDMTTATSVDVYLVYAIEQV